MYCTNVCKRKKKAHYKHKKTKASLFTFLIGKLL